MESQQTPDLDLSRLAGITPGPLPNDIPLSDLATGEEEKKSFYTKEGEKSKFWRSETTKKAIHSIILLNLWVIGIAFGIVVVVRAMHLIFPQHCRWLEKADLDFIDTLLSYLILSAIAGPLFKYITKNIDD